MRQRLQRLARLRAPYATVSAQVQHHLRQLRQAQAKVAEAQAALQTDARASLLALVGQARRSAHPVGPRRWLLLLLGLVGGGALGLGVAVLLGPKSDTSSIDGRPSWQPPPVSYYPHAPNGEVSLPEKVF